MYLMGWVMHLYNITMGRAVYYIGISQGAEQYPYGGMIRDSSARRFPAFEGSGIKSPHSVKREDLSSNPTTPDRDAFCFTPYNPAHQP